MQTPPPTETDHLVLPRHRRPRRWPWYAALTLLAAAAAAWLADVPNRYHAAQAARQGQIALLSSDFPAALRAYRTALTLRPTDFDLQRQYADIQNRWLQTFTRDLEGKTPEAAYAATQQAAAAIDGLLTEPQLGTYRQQVAKVTATLQEKLQGELAAAERLHAAGKHADAYRQLDALVPYAALLPDLAARRRALEATEVQAAIARAGALAAHNTLADTAAARAALEQVAPLARDITGFTEALQKVQRQEWDEHLAAAFAAAAGRKPDFKGAYAHLDAATALKLPAPERTKALARLEEAAREHFGVDTINAISARDASALRTALAGLDQFGHLATAAIDVNQLIGDTLDFTTFSAALRQLHLDTTPETTAYRPDVHLARTALSRFKDPAPARKSIAAAYLTWSHSRAAEHRPALALALYQDALKYGAAPDAAWEKQLHAAVRAETKLTFAVRPGLVPEGNFRSEWLAQATLARLQQLAAQRPDPAWPPVTLLTDDKAPDDPWRIDLYCTLEDKISDHPEITKRSVRYQSGTRRIPNPEYESAREEHNDLMDRRNHLVDLANAQTQRIGQLQYDTSLTKDTRDEEITGAKMEIATYKWQISNYDRKIDALEAKRDSLSPTITEPVYSDEPYEEVTHHHTCTMVAKVTAYWNGTLRAEELARDQAPYTTKEVRGNAAHGVPVEREHYNLATLEGYLAGHVVDRIKAAASVDLAGASWEYVKQRIATSQMEGEDQAELAFDIKLLWQEEGAAVDPEGLCEQSLDQFYFPKVLVMDGV